MRSFAFVFSILCLGLVSTAQAVDLTARCHLDIGVYPISSFFLEGPEELGDAPDSSLKLCKGSINSASCDTVADASIRMEKVQFWSQYRGWVPNARGGQQPALVTEYVARFHIQTKNTTLQMAVAAPPIRRDVHVSSLCFCNNTQAP